LKLLIDLLAIMAAKLCLGIVISRTISVYLFLL